MFEPSYLALHAQGELAARAESLLARLRECDLCPRACGVDRTAGETGVCGAGAGAIVSSFNPHFGEEDPLVGRQGSGTIFLAGCNLGCVFCQNWEVSHEIQGREVTSEELAAMMLALAEAGCHNINFVTPTHAIAAIARALPLAVDGGLRLPLVYNCGGYESVETLKTLEGVFDIYMPDFKFWDGAVSEKFCRAPDYPERARDAFQEMHRQVGDLAINEQGLAERGLLVRHLVMPHSLAGGEHVFRWLAEELSPHTYVNVMDQYRPCGRASDFEELTRRLTGQEYRDAVAAAQAAGLRLDRRDRVRWRLVF
ncbi:MAG: radical SAM protein [Proteobacteria bacterium]|nr:radical SAM protein [Pseudomonadota bacterium]MBU1742913.1 radical SAM protein [Pseudomonadota bacterium]